MTTGEALNDMAYWFPKIEAAGLPVPKTFMHVMPEEAQAAVWEAFDQPGPHDPTALNPALERFFEQVEASAAQIGFPIFLRTGRTSGKHEWDNTCNVKTAPELRAHIYQIAYFSECASMFGELNWTNWAVREFLPIKPYGVCPDYENMPINREFRFFAEDGKVLCHHPYWPPMALERGGAVMDAARYRELCDPADDLPALIELAERASKAVGGAWSVDLLETERGWYLTDMAVASRSWHWPECPHGGGDDD